MELKRRERKHQKAISARIEGQLWVGTEGGAALITPGASPSAIVRTINVGFYMGADAAAAERHEALYQKHWSKDTHGVTGFVRGTPREAKDLVGSYVDAGAYRINIALREGPYDWDALEAFASDVMPQFV